MLRFQMNKTMRRVMRDVFCLMSTAILLAAVARAQAPAAKPAGSPPAGTAPAPVSGQTPAAAPGSAAAPQARARVVAPVQQSSVSVDGSEAMFTTMCALLAAGFESDVSAEHWSPYRAQMREHLQAQQGP